eukprot:scaffold303533_cov31-Attheya_sp.AAC.1
MENQCIMLVAEIANLYVALVLLVLAYHAIVWAAKVYFLIGALYGLNLLLRELVDSKEFVSQEEEDFNIPLSNLWNNHDNRNYPHPTREPAKREVLRMKTQDYEGSARLME